MQKKIMHTSGANSERQHSELLVVVTLLMSTLL